MPTLTTTGLNSEAFNAFVAARHEPPWLVALGREVWEKFQELPWPDASNEEWRRTDIRLFRLDKFAPPKGEGWHAQGSEKGTFCFSSDAWGLPGVAMQLSRDSKQV